jgi:hypothetical protein
LWCSFKLWWNFCLDLLRSKFCLLRKWSIEIKGDVVCIRKLTFSQSGTLDFQNFLVEPHAWIPLIVPLTVLLRFSVQWNNFFLLKYSMTWQFDNLLVSHSYIVRVSICRKCSEYVSGTLVVPENIFYTHGVG